MPRTRPEWIGKTPDEPFPYRVRLRLHDKADGRCSICGRTIVGKLRPRFDHIIALINGGKNAESNGQLLCHECHDTKTVEDLNEKAIVYRKRIKHLGIRKRKGRPMIGSKDSGWKKTFNHGWIKR